ncbi:MAG TPA: MFS transporter [Microlunatus sp.]|nr:MFS transporter [Microlunatus sp.]
MPLTRGRRLLLATSCAAAVATVYSAQPVLAEIGDDLGVDEASLGWVVTTAQIGYLSGLALAVPLGDVLDRRRLAVAQLFLAAAGMTVAAVAPALPVLLVGLALSGVFAVVVQVLVAFAADLAGPEERGRTLGVVTAGVIAGILGARVLAGGAAAAWGWRSGYAGLAVLLSALALLVARLLPPDPPRRRVTYRQALGSFGRLRRDPLFRSRGLIAFFAFASFGTLWSGLALPLAADPWRFGPAEIGLFGLAGLAGTLGAARSGRWADSGRANLVTGGALALLAASWACTGWAPVALWPVVIGTVLLDLAVQAVQVSNQALLTAAHPDRTSSAIGGYMIFYSLGSAFGATATTTLYARFGWTGSSLLGTGLALAGLLVWAVTRRLAGDHDTGSSTRPTRSMIST